MSSEPTNEVVAARIREFIARELLFSPDGFKHSDDASFLEEGIVDSLGVMELVGFVQQSFGLLVDQDDIVPENFGSVRLLAEFVQRKRGAAGK